jgi:hypothetical protein
MSSAWKAGEKAVSKVFDCCNFLNENDLLELRVNQHWDHVDKFIVLEAGQTHTGDPKPFNFDKERFRKYSSKLTYETIDTVDELLEELPNLDKEAQLFLDYPREEVGESTIDWKRDHLQGNHHVKLLAKHGAKPEDIVVITPVDEIISNKGFEDMKAVFANEKQLFPLKKYIDKRYGNERRTAEGVKMVRPIFGFNMKFFFHKLNLFCNVQCCGQVAEYSTLQAVCPAVARSLSASTHPCLGGDAGWHFSCMDDGSGKMIHQKYSSWAHSKDSRHGEGNRYRDMDTPEKALERVKSDFGHMTKKIEINYENHPAYLVDNQDKFKHLIA